MTPQRQAAWEIEMEDQAIRAALERHWAASDANDFAVEHEIYSEDAVLHYPQSGERIRGRRKIQESRTVQPSEKRFTVQRIIGDGDLWVTEFVLSYDGVPSYTVSIMEIQRRKGRPRDAVFRRFVQTRANSGAPGRAE
jgi:ketosteroid isomerase-like protein